MTQSILFFKHLLDSLSSAILVVHFDGQLIYANQMACKLYKITGDFNSIICSGNFFGIEDNKISERLKMVRNGGKFARLEFKRKTVEGVKHYFEMIGEIASNDENSRYLILTTTDITEDKLFEKELLQREKMASVGQVTSSFAHEIKNPLTGIRLGLDALRERMDADDLLTSITDDVKRLDRILKQLLDFSKVREKNKTEIDINKLVEKSIFLLRKQAESEKIKIETEYSIILPKIFADKNHIQQVLVNIVLNAIQATSENGLIIIKTSNYSRNKILGVLIEVEDNGVGISEEVQHKVNSLFYTTKTHGTGLGLAMSQKIIREHGGSLLFDSKEGVGTKFQIFLPIEI